MTDTLVDRIIRRQGWLEPVADAIQAAVGKGFGALGRPGTGARSMLYGTRVLGHPLHPALTDLPVGAWIAGAVADYAAHFTGRIPTEAGDPEDGERILIDRLWPRGMSRERAHLAARMRGLAPSHELDRLGR